MAVRERSRPVAQRVTAGKVVHRVRTGRSPFAKTGTGLFTNKSSEEDENLDPQLLELKRYTSAQITDPFTEQYRGGSVLSILKPAYSPHALARLPNENSILRQCIDAYVVNIEGNGYRLEFIGEEGQEDSNEAIAEYNRIISLLDQPNSEYSLTEMRQRMRRDHETFGYGFLEVGRDNMGEVSLLYHLPAQTVRMTAKDAKPTMVKRWFYRNGQPVQKTVAIRFRRFVQQVGASTIYFKEFGDPRSIDPATGQEANLPIEQQATEVYHIGQYVPGDAYGLPRWINQLPSVLGTRESEMTNLQFFKDNAIPALAILVAGGMLTDDAVENIENHFTKDRGRASVNKVLVIEAIGSEAAADEDGKIPAPKVEMKPLAGERQTDGMFQTYEENSMVKIRSSFRLPPLFLGRTEDMTYATASASLQVAESQVFGPERGKVDDMFNLHILATDGEQPTYWRMRSLPPKITDPKEIVDAIEKLDKAGAMTPNIAIGLANELFDLNIPTVEDDWGNYPMALSEIVMQEGVLAGVEHLYSSMSKPGTTEPTEDDTAVSPSNDNDDVEDEAEAKVNRGARRRVRLAASKVVRPQSKRMGRRI